MTSSDFYNCFIYAGSKIPEGKENDVIRKVQKDIESITFKNIFIEIIKEQDLNNLFDKLIIKEFKNLSDLYFTMSEVYSTLLYFTDVRMMTGIMYLTIRSIGECFLNMLIVENRGCDYIVHFLNSVKIYRRVNEKWILEWYRKHFMEKENNVTSETTYIDKSDTYSLSKKRKLNEEKETRRYRIWLKDGTECNIPHFNLISHKIGFIVSTVYYVRNLFVDIVNKFSIAFPNMYEYKKEEIEDYIIDMIEFLRKLLYLYIGEKIADKADGTALIVYIYKFIKLFRFNHRDVDIIINDIDKYCKLYEAYFIKKSKFEIYI